MAPPHEILIPVRRRHETTRSALENVVTQKQQWGYAENEDLILIRRENTSRRYFSRSSLMEPDSVYTRMLVCTATEITVNYQEGDVDIRMASNVDDETFYMRGSDGLMGVKMIPNADWLQDAGTVDNCVLEFSRGDGAGDCSIYSYSGTLNLLSNSYNSEADARFNYIGAVQATRIQQILGSIILTTAAAGVAGNEVLWTNATSNSLVIDSTVGTVINNNEGDHDFRAASEVDTTNLYMRGSDGHYGIKAIPDTDWKQDTGATDYCVIEFSEGASAMNASIYSYNGTIYILHNAYHSEANNRFNYWGTGLANRFYILADTLHMESAVAGTAGNEVAFATGNDFGVSSVSDYGTTVNAHSGDFDYHIHADSITDAFYLRGSDGLMGVKRQPNADWLQDAGAVDNCVIEFSRGDGVGDCSVYSYSGTLNLLSNSYNSETNARFNYIGNAQATRIQQILGSVIITAAATGVAGNEVLWTNATSNSFVVSSTIGTIVNNNGGDHDFRVVTDNEIYTIYADGGVDSVGVGTGTPLLNIGTTDGDLDRTKHRGLHILGDSTEAAVGDRAYLIVEGTGNDGNGSTGQNAAHIVMACNHTGATADRRILDISHGGGITNFRSLEDDLTFNVDNILVLDMNSGYVGVGTDSATAKLHVANDAVSNYVHISDDFVNLSLGVHSAVQKAFVGTTNGYELEFQTNGNHVMTLLESGFVGIGLEIPTAQCHIDQSSDSGAIPVLRLDQADIDDSFIDFIGTSAADGSRSISSDTTEDSAKFGAIRIEINGVTKWIRIYDDWS